MKPSVSLVLSSVGADICKKVFNCFYWLRLSTAEIAENGLGQQLKYPKLVFA